MKLSDVLVDQPQPLSISGRRGNAFHGGVRSRIFLLFTHVSGTGSNSMQTPTGDLAMVLTIPHSVVLFQMIPK